MRSICLRIRSVVLQGGAGGRAVIQDEGAFVHFGQKPAGQAPVQPITAGRQRRGGHQAEVPAVEQAVQQSFTAPMEQVEELAGSFLSLRFAFGDEPLRQQRDEGQGQHQGDE
jgi:hypothetical protein